MTDHDWVLIDEVPPAHAQIVYFAPEDKYIWAIGRDYQRVKAEYPECTHWRVVWHPPMSRVQINAFPRG